MNWIFADRSFSNATETEVLSLFCHRISPPHLVLSLSRLSLTEAALHSLLGALTSETYDDTTQHLEREQALAKQFAEILHFTLRFDELKVRRLLFFFSPLLSTSPQGLVSFLLSDSPFQMNPAPSRRDTNQTFLSLFTNC